MCDRSHLRHDDSEQEIADQRGVAIAFRVPGSLAREIEQRAASEFISVAAFCRRAAARDVQARLVAGRAE